MRHTRLPAGFLLSMTILASAAAEMRIWTDASGERTVEAEFVTFQGDKAWFHRTDGRIFGVGLDELSESDRAFLKEEIGRREKERGITENPAGRVHYGPGEAIATLANQAIDESSGIACSRRLDGAFWTHNDSGGDANIYLFDRTGRDLGACRLEGVDAFAKPPRKIVMPERIQGEAICYGRDGKRLYLTSEKQPTPLFEVGVSDEP